MLLELVLFFTLAAAITTAAVMVPGLVRARAWSGIPLALAILFGAGWLTGLIVHDPVAATILPLFGVGALIETAATFRNGASSPRSCCRPCWWRRSCT